MFYLTPALQGTLQQAFDLHNMHLKVQSDYFIVENSSNCTEEKIKSIISSAGFCPFVYQDQSSKNFSFSVFPYKLPDFFSQPLGMTQEKDPYISLDDLSKLLSPKSFHGEGVECTDPWAPVNRIRGYISPALDKALSEILEPLLKERNLMIEIGAGKGYTLLEPVSSKTVRIQPGLPECQLLRKATTAPIYQLDIEELDRELSRTGKKIPLFVGIDVFDQMSQREANFKKLSSHQIPGDKIVSIHDTNPHVNGMIAYLEKQHPGYVVLPYYPLKFYTCAPFSIILVPKDKWPGPSDLLSFKMMAQHAANALRADSVTQEQKYLHYLQHKFQLEVISLEDAYVKLVKSELESCGYSVQSSYHAAFTPIDEKNVPKELAEQDFTYKPVTDVGMIRSWYRDDPVIRESLSKKKITLPPEYFDEDNFEKLREKHQKFIGAEILVIEATKM